MKRMHIGHWMISIAALLALAMAPVAAHAQARTPVQLSEGNLQLLDCEESVFMFSTPDGTVQFKATRLTAYFAGADRLQQLCALTPFLGTRARVWWASVDGVRVAGRIQVLVFPAQAVVSDAFVGGDHNDIGSGGSGDSGGGDSGGGDSGGGDSGGGDSGGGDSGGGGGGGGGAHGNDKDRGHGNEDDGQKGSKGDHDPDNTGNKP